MLLDRGADIHVKDEEGTTALIAAANKGQINCISILLDRGSDINYKNGDGASALMAAAQFGNANMCTLLLDRTADINARNIQGRTPLMVKQWDRKHLIFIYKTTNTSCFLFSIYFVLIFAVIFLNDVFRCIWNCQFASQRGHPSCISLLVGRGAHHVDVTDNKGATCLMMVNLL